MSPRHLICSMFACAAFMAAPSIADAQEIKQAGNFGIGLGAGTYTSLLSMKYFLSSDLSLQGVVGPYRYGFYCNRGYYGRGCNGWRRNDALAVSLDVLSERGTIAGNGDLTLDWQIGGGVGLGILGGGQGVDLAVAFVPGLQLNIHAIPIDLVAEYRPKVHLDGFYFDFWDFTAHIRYYF